MWTAVRRALLWAAVLAFAVTCFVGAVQKPPSTVGMVRCGYGALDAHAVDTGTSVVSDVEPPARERTVTAAVASEEPWHPIRIAVFTHALFNRSTHCTYPYQKRKDSRGKKYVCHPEDVLTRAKRRTLVELLIPSAAKLHSDRLSVQRVSGNIVVSPSIQTNRICREFSIPASHMTTGVPDADFVLYLSAAPINGVTAAWALTCQQFDNGRPAVGVANVAPRVINANEQMVRLIAHEILHAMGFGVNIFKRNRMISIMAFRGKEQLPVISSPNVAAHAMAHYGCNTSAFMELEDEGGPRTDLSHWKRRNAKDELMAGYMGAGIYSAMTIAAMEDMGYYKGNYSNAEPMTYGRNVGCSLTTSQCLINGVSQFPDMFCASTLKKGVCVSDRSAVGQCILLYYPERVPALYQYFANDTVGGSDAMMDYCPEVETYDYLGCQDKTIRLPGSAHGLGSKCLDTPNGFSIDSMHHSQYGICANVKCGISTYFVKVNGSPTYTACPAGTEIDLRAISPMFEEGTLKCPPFDSVCGMKSDVLHLKKYADLIAAEKNSVEFKI